MHGTWRWRRGRPLKPRTVRFRPEFPVFIPSTRLPPTPPPVTLTLDELEALRLVDYNGLLQEEAAKLMEVSRGTLWRILENARRKVIAMMIEGRPLVIVPVEER